jgi:hypothetical protein
MNVQDEFFSSKHKALLSLATWAKYLAWVALIANILLAAAAYFREQNYYGVLRTVTEGGFGDFWDALSRFPLYAFGVAIEILNIIFNGAVYFLVLKGVSLGLNMIVETDINYREKRRAGGAA